MDAGLHGALPRRALTFSIDRRPPDSRLRPRRRRRRRSNPADTHTCRFLWRGTSGAAPTCNPQVSRRETCKCVSAGWAVRERVSGVENVSGSPGRRVENVSAVKAREKLMTGLGSGHRATTRGSIPAVVPNARRRAATG